MEERIRFVKDGKAGLYTMTELCERYRISRKTGYKWLARFEAGGAALARLAARRPWTAWRAASSLGE